MFLKSLWFIKMFLETCACALQKLAIMKLNLGTRIPLGMLLCDVMVKFLEFAQVGEVLQQRSQFSGSTLNFHTASILLDSDCKQTWSCHCSGPCNEGILVPDRELRL